MSVEIEQEPPNDPQAEEAVLCACLIDPDAIPRVQAIAVPEDFHDQKRRWVYESIMELQNQGSPTNTITLADQMRQAGTLEAAGGESYLTFLISVEATSLYAVHYAQIVEKLASRRRLMDAAGVIAATAYDDTVDVVEAHEESVKIVMEAGSRQVRQPRPLNELVADYYDHIEFLARNDRPPGLPTGYIDLDAILGGLHNTDFVILAARPSMGKTALALNVTLNVAKKFGTKVGFFSLEMSNEQVTQRLVSMESAISTTSLRHGTITEQEWPAFAKSNDTLSKLDIFVDDTPGISPVELRTKASALHMAHGLDLLVVDYIQLMRDGGRSENRRIEIMNISHALKALAKDLKIPVLALSQLSRACETRLNKRPILSDLRESGDLEQDADVVMFLYRDVMYDPETETPNIAELAVAKHRNGPTGTVNLFFEGHLTRFLNAEVRSTNVDAKADWLS